MPLSSRIPSRVFRFNSSAEPGDWAAGEAAEKRKNKKTRGKNLSRRRITVLT
jgi:hypothetical protein